MAEAAAALALFDAVVDLPRAEQQRALEQADGSPSLLDEVRRMLEADRAQRLNTLAPGDLGTGVALDELQAPELWADRYVDLGPIAGGGMGEVRRVRDTVLNRVLAMKIIRAEFVGNAEVMARFMDEAQCCGQLEHPSIVPVHDLGRLPDGRAWFTMKEVRGHTLGSAIASFHRLARADDDTLRGLRRLVDAFLRVCDAVGYAHARSVVHRDLKPNNVMLGEHGEVLVLDWGLAKVLADGGAAWSGAEAVVTERSRDGVLLTQMGNVAGTPSYMAPEQARGEVDQIDERTDIYALGTLLYEVLSGRPPFVGSSARAVIAQVRFGAPEPPTACFPLPKPLLEVCARAMAHDPADRYRSVHELAAEVEAWMEGSRRREQALDVVARARAATDAASAVLESAAELEARGEALLEGIAPWEPEERKWPGWSALDQATALRGQARLHALERSQHLSAALSHAPMLAEAHAALVEDALGAHARADEARDPHAMREQEFVLERHLRRLATGHPVRVRAERWMRAQGALSVVVDPPGAEVELYRYEERNRRLHAVRVGSLGRAPLIAVELPVGSYLCVIRHPGREDLRYPVQIRREAHWDGVAPGDREPTPVRMLEAGSLPPNACYVPAGWYAVGGDPNVDSLTGEHLWCEAFAIDRFQVTNARYLEFLDDRVAQDRVEEALMHAPREREGVAGEVGALVYGFDGQKFTMQVDADGDRWDPEYPVLQVDWHGARAFLEWLAERSGRPWRLPSEREWEKAARGVDGRWYPWGDTLDPSWCNMSHSHRGRRMPSRVGVHPVDTSVYGVGGLAGNAQEWCLDRYNQDSWVKERRVCVPAGLPAGGPHEHRSARGASWTSDARRTRSAMRYRFLPASRFGNLGFRGLLPL